MQILVSLLGMCVLIGIALLCSTNRQAIKLKTIFSAFVLQVGIGVFVLYSTSGGHLLGALSSGMSHIISYGDKGIAFLFGGLASPQMFSLFGSGGFIFALRVLPIIIFFSSLIAVLYYIGVMQFIIRILGGLLQKCLGTSRTESMSATANIFVGQTEAPLIVKPYIATMTQSELFAVMCGGLASIAGAVMAGYAQMGVPLTYLIAASFMSAPGGLLFAKIMVPETEKSNHDVDANQLMDEDSKPANVIDAAATGAADGLHLALAVGAMLLAFIALLALLNGILGGICSWFGLENITFELILGWIFSPLAFLIGIPWQESMIAGSFIGQKMVLNEFVAYSNFSPYLQPDSEVIAQGLLVMSEKTKAIISFALCGFANISSIAILIGGLGGMAPNRRKDIARFGMKAVLAGMLSNLMSAIIAGICLSL